MKKMITLNIDGKEVQAEGEKSLLEVCLDNGIYVPHLCHMEGMEAPPASCRLCFVEIDGMPGPVVSCRVSPKRGMLVRTDTEAVRRLQRTALRLLLSVHCAECRTCPSNKKCELQRMARLLGVRLRPRRFPHIDRQMTAQFDDALFELVPCRCVLCGKCIHVCEKRNGRSFLTFAKRGFETVITSFGDEGAAGRTCGKECRACVEVCPVSAILFKDLRRASTVTAGGVHGEVEEVGVAGWKND